MHVQRDSTFIHYTFYHDWKTNVEERCVKQGILVSSGLLSLRVGQKRQSSGHNYKNDSKHKILTLISIH